MEEWLKSNTLKRAMLKEAQRREVLYGGGNR
jgi:hypothetical protein